MAENTLSENDSFPARADSIKDNKLAERLRETPVIDLDVHVDFYDEEIQQDIADNLKEPYQKQLKYYLSDQTSYGNSGYGSDTWDRDLMGKAPTVLTSVTDPQRDIADILPNEFHIDYPILNPLPEINVIPQADKAVEYMKAINDMLIERFLDGYDQFHGLGTVVPHDPDKSAEEIDRMGKEDQIVGILINTTGVKTPLGDPEYEIMYRAAEDNDLPVVHHAAAAPGVEIDFPILQYELNTYFGNHALTHIFSQLVNLVSLFENGIPEKFPDLDFVFQEAGIAWITQIFRLNREYKERRAELPLLEKTPEEYLRDQFYFGTQPMDEPNDPRYMKQIIDMVGPECLMFATDYPHFDVDNTESFMRHLSGFSDEEVEKVLYKNASNVFGIEV